jgi:hypothetical protein
MRALETEVVDAVFAAIEPLLRYWDGQQWTDSFTPPATVITEAERHLMQDEVLMAQIAEARSNPASLRRRDRSGAERSDWHMPGLVYSKQGLDRLRQELNGTGDENHDGSGDAWHRSRIESFWGALKRELRHIHGDLERFSRSEMRTILFDHIEVFYNRQRHQQGLDHRTPAEVYAAASPDIS